MSSVYVVVEGKTEEIFVREIVAPALAEKGIYLSPTQVTKKGQKGGDVCFERVKIDIRNYLKQRSDTYVTTFIDYYGIKSWPGVEAARGFGNNSEQVAITLGRATLDALCETYPDLDISRRFIPFIAIHEFEALLFSDSRILAQHIGIASEKIDEVLLNCGGPERVNNSRETAPSKRLLSWMCNYKKTVTGIEIARDIGLKKIREMCPVFNRWISTLESLADY